MKHREMMYEQEMEESEKNESGLQNENPHT